MVFLGIDLGGTNIKAAVVDEQHAVLSACSRPTLAQRGADAVCADIVLCLQEAIEQAGLAMEDIAAIGVGCPGTVDAKNGVVVYSNNLHWRDVPLVQTLAGATGKPVYLGNDANVAALGEVAAGCAKGADSAVIITLGTGVGSGVVLGGEILTGFGGGASEIGHSVIVEGGRECTCGRRGCLEAYASATGLIAATRQAIEKHPESRMAALAKARGKVSGRTSFDAMREGDEAAREVVEDYIRYLACGVTNIVNTFQPEVVAFSGGLSNEGEGLLAPLRKQVEAEMFGGPPQRMTRFEVCTLGSRAGVIGAAQLACQSMCRGAG